MAKTYLTGRVTLALSLFVLALVLTVWQLWPRTESPWARVQRTGEIRVGYSLEEPYAFRDAQGQMTGESPTVARAILSRLGVRRVEWVQAEFATLIPKLRAGRFDLIAAGMFRTPDRERQVAFSQPTACVRHGFLVPRSNPRQLGDYPDFARTDARLAVLAGAVERDHARRAGIPDARVIAFPDVALAMRGIQTGLVEALALSDPSVRLLARSWPGFEAVVPGPATGREPDPYGGCAAIAFRAEDEELRLAFDQELGRYLGTEAHLRAVRPFGFDRRNLPDRTGESQSTMLLSPTYRE